MGEEMGSGQYLLNLVYPMLGQPVSQWVAKNGRNNLIVHFISRTSNPIRAIKYWLEYGFNPFDNTPAIRNFEPDAIKMVLWEFAW